MAKNKTPKWLSKLKLQKNLNAYSCEHTLAGASIEITLFCKNKKTLESLATSAEEVLANWPNEVKAILKELRDELIEQKGLSRRQATKINAEALVPFSFSAEPDDIQPAFYSYGINVTDITDEDEYINYCADFAKTWTTIELCCTE